VSVEVAKLIKANTTNTNTERQECGTECCMDKHRETRMWNRMLRGTTRLLM